MDEQPAQPVPKTSDDDDTEMLRVLYDSAMHWRTRAAKLWQLLDAIDTLDDSCRSDDALFRDEARAVQKRRHEIWNRG